MYRGLDTPRKWKRAQSSLEYVTLFSVIVASIVIGQAFLKRRSAGYLKEQASQISSQGWSFSGSQEKSVEVLHEDQIVTEKVNTDDLGENVYSHVERTGGTTTMKREGTTDSLKEEKYKFDEYQQKKFNDYELSE